MKINKGIIKLGVTLMIITIIATVALSSTNDATKDKIEEQLEAQLLYSLAEVMPGADDFKEIDNYFEVYKNNELIGKVLRIDAQGYSSVIKLIVGINLENKITGVVVLSQLETPGLGANVEKNEFLEQFIGKTKEKLKIKKDDGEIDAVTGATISSRAVTNGIREMIAKSSGQDDFDPSPEPQETDVINEFESEGEKEETNMPAGAAVYIDHLKKKLAEQNETE